jgi:signal transduction histidine kinase
MIELAKVPPELFAPILAGNLRQVGPSRKLYAHFLEAAQLRLAADACWLTRPGEGERSFSGERLFPGGRLWAGDAALCDERLARAFLRWERPAIPAEVVLVSLHVHGRQVAVVGAALRQGELGAAARRVLERLCGVLAHELESREEERLTKVLDRIREKIVSELRPRDLAYQILDGLHQLVEYDHSSAFLAYDCESGVFRIEAEKIVWTKAKSPFVGREIRLPAEQMGRLSRAIEIRSASNWSRSEADPGFAASVPEAVPAAGADALYELLDYHRGAGSPPVDSLLSAPLFYDGEFLGILKMATWQRPAFGPHDVAVVERFLPAAAVSMRNARVNRSLERQAVEAEVKASLVTLSHAVAHDVNNAVGSILPLAQQMRFELRHGGEELDRETFDRDLGVIIDNARLCQRIFSNMLRVASSGRPGDKECPVDAAQIVAETMPFLLALASRRGIEIALDLAPGLPAARVARPDLQHIVLNLARNSLQALAEQPEASGGRVEIALREAPGGSIELSVTDDGPGIPTDLLSKVQEPFFSTRPGGTGLGLSICRALAWQNGGTLSVESPLPSAEMAALGSLAPMAVSVAVDAAETLAASRSSATATMAVDAVLGVAPETPGGTRVTVRFAAERRPPEVP